jgi:hypothetical protein
MALSYADTSQRSRQLLEEAYALQRTANETIQHSRDLIERSRGLADALEQMRLERLLSMKKR